jgi:hypothetical protein
MSTPITESAIYANIDGCEVSIYLDDEDRESTDLPCSVCGKVRVDGEKDSRGDFVYIYKTIDLPIIEIQSNGVKFLSNHPVFREVQRRISSSKALGKAFCNECNFDDGVLAEFEASLGFKKFSELLDEN